MARGWGLIIQYIKPTILSAFSAGAAQVTGPVLSKNTVSWGAEAGQLPGCAERLGSLGPRVSASAQPLKQPARQLPVAQAPERLPAAGLGPCVLGSADSARGRFHWSLCFSTFRFSLFPLLFFVLFQEFICKCTYFKRSFVL